MEDQTYLAFEEESVVSFSIYFVIKLLKAQTIQNKLFLSNCQNHQKNKLTNCNPTKRSVYCGLSKFDTFRLEDKMAIINYKIQYYILIQPYSFMSSKRRVFITGTERGLGRSLVKVIHEKHPQLEVHITARNKTQELAEEWQKIIPKTDFRVYQLELRDSNNIKELVQRFKKDNIRFDYIVANAGFGVDFGQEKPSVAVAEQTIKTNFDSTVDFIKQFLPLLSKDGRIVVVSSVMGALKEQGESIRKKLQDKNISQEELFKLSDEFIKAAKQQKMGDFNWSAYRTSKALLNCWSRFILPKLLKEGQTVVTMHPGACRTSMGGINAELSPEQGAKRIFDTLELKQVKQGCFYNNKFCDYEQCQ